MSEWIDEKKDSPWLIIVVQKSSHQVKLFKYQLAEKLRSDVQAQYKTRICSIKVNEGQNEDQWIELTNRIKVHTPSNPKILHPFSFSFIFRIHLSHPLTKEC